VLRPGRCSFETTDYEPWPVIYLTTLTLRCFCSIQIRLEQSFIIFAIYVSRQMVELFLITHGFQNHNILCVQWNITTVPALMKEFLGNQIDTHIPVMSAFPICHIRPFNRIRLTNRLGLWDTVVVKVCQQVLDKPNVFRPGQLSRGDGTLLAIAPDDNTVKWMYGTECFEVLQGAYIKRRLAWPTHQPTKRMLESEIVPLGGPCCNTVLSAVPCPYLYPKVTDEWSYIGLLLKKDIL